MKIVVAGEWSDNAMEIPIVTAWRKLGHDVIMVAWPLKSRVLYWLSRIQDQLGNPHTILGKRYNAWLRKVLEEEKPDVFFVFKGMNVWENTIEWAASRGIYSVNYNPDHPFVFSGKGSGNSIVRRSVKLYDCHITYSRTIIKSLRLYGVQSELVPFGYELPLHWTELKESIHEELSGAFIGNADDDRLFWLSHFLSAYEDNKFVFYGHGWEKLKVGNKNVEIRNPVYGIDFWLAMRRHRFQLNVMRVHNLDSHNMRSIESLAAGAIGIHPSTADHRAWMEHGKHGFLFESFAEAARIGDELLRMDSESAKYIREQTEACAMALNGTYSERAKQMLDLISDKLK
jgi:spore maturation protein CgeB